MTAAVEYHGPPCPVCGGKVVNDYLDRIEGTTLERRDYCPRGCWETTFAYGYYQLRVGTSAWDWTWTEPDDEAVTRQQQIRDAVATARANFLAGQLDSPASPA